MASVCVTPSGSKQVRLGPNECPTVPASTRPRIGLGKVNARAAATICGHIEAICRAKRACQPIPDATAAWVADLAGKLRRRLEALGLLAPAERAECPALGAWLADYIGARQDVKAGTATVYGHTRRNLEAFFGVDRRLDEITLADADDFAVYLRTTAGLAENTARRRMGIAKQFMRKAVRKRLLASNPFDGQAVTVRGNPKRFYFVSREEAQAVLDACPDVRWRLVFALARFGGLRCPSEIMRLTWADLDWERGRFRVFASKTEHHEGGGERVVPMFPELLSYFRDAFDAAPDGQVHCCPQYEPASAGMMYRKAVVAMVHAAGLKVWPKLFQNCRSTRETELAEQYPMHVVCEWIGNSVPVASKHYLQVTEDHYAQAAAGGREQDRGQDRGHNRGQTVRSSEGHEETGSAASAVIPDSDAAWREESVPDNCCQNQPVGDTGFEPVTSRV